MKHVRKSVLLWYSAREMYDLVTAVDHYPVFLPWCSKAEVLEREANAVKARLHLHYAGLSHAFTTRNVHETNRSVTMTLVDGPFSSLDGRWDFLPLGDAGADGTPASGCKVDFDLRYAFASTALEAVVSPVFDRIAATFVDAFVRRAESVHGAR
jgi:ribosome-associated toxin RatA of RatAB toxin-antitoxin module